MLKFCQKLNFSSFANCLMIPHLQHSVAWQVIICRTVHEKNDKTRKKYVHKAKAKRNCRWEKRICYVFFSSWIIFFHFLLFITNKWKNFFYVKYSQNSRMVQNAIFRFFFSLLLFFTYLSFSVSKKGSLFSNGSKIEKD